MLGVTFFGIFLTPVFYYVLQGLSERTRKRVPDGGTRDDAPSSSEKQGRPGQADPIVQEPSPCGFPVLGGLVPTRANGKTTCRRVPPPAS